MFEMFPYTNFHELNLDYILRQVKANSADVEEMKRIISTANIPELVREKLLQMVEDGTLEELLDRLVRDYVLNEHWAPNEEDRQAFEKWVAECVVSYLVNMPAAACDSIAGTPSYTNLRYVPIYLDIEQHLPVSLMSYDAIVNNNIGDFGKYSTEGFTPGVSGNHNTITVAGQTYPIMYCNCSHFVTQVCSGRRYQDSVWYNLFTRPNIDAKQLAVKAIPYGDMADKPWTLDYMNLYYTWRMAECMNASGCTVNPIAKEENGAMVITNYFDTMRDGDVLFFGNKQRFPTRYRGIHHCALYFKTLDKLNEAAAAYGVTCKPFDNGDPSLGYVVDCSGSTDGVVRGTKNVFKISTMAYTLRERTVDNEVIYFAKTDANALNSSKLHQNATGTLIMFNCELSSGVREYSQTGDSISFDSVKSFGGGNDKEFSYGYHRTAQEETIVQSGGTLDADEYFGARKAGIYGVTATNVNLVNFPTTGNVYNEGTTGVSIMQTPSQVNFIFESVSPFVSETGIQLQRVTTVYQNTPHKWERCQNYNGQKSKWRCIY